MKKKKLNLEKKLGKYAMATSVALVASAGCSSDPDNPNVVYIDIADVNLNAPVNSDVVMSFDIDGDGVDDIQVEVGNYVDSPGFDFTYSEILAEGINRLVTQAGTIISGPYTYDTQFLTPLDKGTTIGATSTILAGYGYGAVSGTAYASPVAATNPFAGKEKYVGLQFKVAAATHYAWIRMTVSQDGGSVTIHDYAYNSVADESLEAGEI